MRENASNQLSGRIFTHNLGNSPIADVVAPPSVVVWLTWDAACQQHRWPVCNSWQGTAEPCHADTRAWWHQAYTLLDLPHRANVSHHARCESGCGWTDDRSSARCQWATWWTGVYGSNDATNSVKALKEQSLCYCCYVSVCRAISSAAHTAVRQCTRQ